MHSSAYTAGEEAKPHLGVFLPPDIQGAGKVDASVGEGSGLLDSEDWQLRGWNALVRSPFKSPARWTLVDFSSHHLSALEYPIATPQLSQGLLAPIVHHSVVCFPDEQSDKVVSSSKEDWTSGFWIEV